MKVLGISPLDKDATVSIVEDGRVLYAAGEERFSRVKLQSGFPRKSLEDALRATNTRAEDISQVAYAFLGWQQEAKLFDRNYESEVALLDTHKREKRLGDLIDDALKKVPERREPIAGLANPNDLMRKGGLKRAFYHFASETGI